MVITNAARKRLLRNALLMLRAGRSVVIVAHPSEEAVSIARTLCHLAKQNAIACRNIRGTTEDAPAVRARAFGQTAKIDRAMPLELRPVVMIDQSAVFERGCVRPMAVRTVFF